jgi:PTS system nitrogen regulatory IIA component
MKLQTILTPERTLCSAPGESKKSVLENIAEFIAPTISDLDAHTIFACLVTREKLGSTGIGKGIAIPHCRLRNCPKVIGALITLQNKVDFEAIDDEPVDLLFVLLVPEQATDEHLQILAGLARMFNEDSFCSRLREASDNNSLYQIATGEQPADVA